jgi:hypothetical protein
VTAGTVTHGAGKEDVLPRPQLAAPIRELSVERPHGASRSPELVQVPELAFLMIDGHGDPNTSTEYREAIQALYALSYTLKFSLKKELGLAYRVGPLEGLWWADDMTLFEIGRKADWRWTAMIAQPGAVTHEWFELTRDEVQHKKPLRGLERVRLERFEEGLAAQVLYLGPYSDEGPTIERLHRFIHELGYRFDGRHQKHHEIYLGDPRRSAPEKLRTIIRQPVAGSAVSLRLDAP